MSVSPSGSIERSWRAGASVSSAIAAAENAGPERSCASPARHRARTWWCSPGAREPTNSTDSAWNRWPRQFSPAPYGPVPLPAAWRGDWPGPLETPVACQGDLRLACGAPLRVQARPPGRAPFVEGTTRVAESRASYGAEEAGPVRTPHLEPADWPGTEDLARLRRQVDEAGALVAEGGTPRGFGSSARRSARSSAGATGVARRWRRCC